jgi:limonene 1,2-monooxygenase
MRFGYFLAPYHAPGLNPTLGLERDLELGTLCDQLGYDEFWVGEHHSGGHEIIASPEIFLAVLAERTRHIRLGTGVVSAPYHNPFHVASRAVLLDHLTRGRVMLGLGPGQLASDMHMLGIDVLDSRPRLVEALGVIRRLLDGEIVTRDAGWFNLNEARLQLAPYSRDGIEMAVTGTVTANGARMAGDAGIGLLSMAATTPQGFEALRAHWQVYGEAAAAAGRAPDRGRWRVVGPMHLAETREQAEAEVAWGIQTFARYFHFVTPGGILPGDSVAEILKSNRERQIAVIGTPQDAVERIQQLVDRSGGFGTCILLGHEWARPEATRNSLRLFADEVIPHFNGQAAAQTASFAWVDGRAAEFAEINARPFAQGRITASAGNPRKDAAE